MNGRAMQQAKITDSTWTFQGGELTVTNGEGQSQTFVLSSEGRSRTDGPSRTSGTEPGVLRLEASGPGPSSAAQKSGWILWMRDREDLIVAFQDNLDGRPDGMHPGPKTIVARLRRSGPEGKK